MEELTRVLHRGGSLEGVNAHAADRILVGFASWFDRQRRAAGHRARGRIRTADIFIGIGDEAVHATRRAETVTDTQVLSIAPGLGGID